MQEFHPKEFHRCPTCDKVFTSAALLDKHKSTHVGSKPFSCDLCNRSYQVNHSRCTPAWAWARGKNAAFVATATVGFVVP